MKRFTYNFEASTFDLGKGEIWQPFVFALSQKGSGDFCGVTRKLVSKISVIKILSGISDKGYQKVCSSVQLCA
jgi:hypothetical protein